MRTVFISYAPADREKCEQFAVALRERGFVVQYEENPDVHKNHILSDHVQRELRACSVFVLLLSPASVTSEYVLVQAGAYLKTMKHESSRLFLPILLQPCDIPQILSGIIRMSAINRSIEATIENLVSVLNTSQRSRRVLLATISGVLVTIGGGGWIMTRERASVPTVPANHSPKVPLRIIEYRGHDGGVYAIAWSPPDGAYMASASEDQTAQIWDTKSGKQLQVYHGHTDQIYGIAWSPNGKSIVSGSDDNTAQIWQAFTGQHLLTYSRHTSVVNTVAWSPNGKSIASCGGDQTAQVWEAATGSRLAG